MNKDTVIALAIEAGAHRSHNPELWDIWNIRDTDLERFATLVAAHEREECAQVVEASPSYDWHRFACEAAAAIRSRT